MIDCTITQTRAEKGRLISIADSKIKLQYVEIMQQTKISEDNYGIVLTDGELEVDSCIFSGDYNVDFYQNIYQKSLGEINGAFISSYANSEILVQNSTF